MWGTGSDGCQFHRAYCSRTKLAWEAWIVTEVFLLLLVVLGAVFFIGHRKEKKRQRELHAAELQQVKKTAEEDVTAFGEEVAELDVITAGVDLDTGGAQDYKQALDSYDVAKETLEKVSEPTDIRHVTEALEDGRYAAKCVRARSRRQNPCRCVVRPASSTPSMVPRSKTSTGPRPAVSFARCPCAPPTPSASLSVPIRWCARSSPVTDTPPRLLGGRTGLRRIQPRLLNSYAGSGLLPGVLMGAMMFGGMGGGWDGAYGGDMGDAGGDAGGDMGGDGGGFFGGDGGDGGGLFDGFGDMF